MNFLGILIAILIFGLIIAVHEAGHFVAAKLNGVKVNQFALGMGPAIFKFQKGETLYALRLFPIGGYCQMEGEDDESADDRAFGKRPVWRRIIIIVAGAFMNLVLGVVLIAIMVVQSGAITSRTVSYFYENASSHETGLELGDKVINVNGMRLFTVTDFNYQLASDEDGVFDMTVIRDGKKVQLNDVTLEKNGDNLIIDFKVAPISLTVGSVAKETLGRTASFSRLVWISLRDLIGGRYKINDLSGPVGIVDAIDDVIDSQTNEQAQIDWSGLAQTMLGMGALITINIGLFNLLPLPALDGGRLVFLIIEGIRRKPVKPEHEGMVHFVGFALLMVLMVVVTFNDIVKIFK